MRELGQAPGAPRLAVRGAKPVEAGTGQPQREALPVAQLLLGGAREPVEREGLLGSKPRPQARRARGHEQRAVGPHGEDHRVGDTLEAIHRVIGADGRALVPQDRGEQGPVEAIVERLRDLIGAERLAAKHPSRDLGAQRDGATEPAPALLLPQPPLLVEDGVDVAEHPPGGDLQRLDQQLAVLDVVGEANHPPRPGHVLPDAIGLDQIGGVDPVVQHRGGEAQRVGGRAERTLRARHNPREDVLDVREDRGVHLGFELDVLPEGGRFLQQAPPERLTQRADPQAGPQRNLSHDLLGALAQSQRGSYAQLSLKGNVHERQRLQLFAVLDDWPHVQIKKSRKGPHKGVRGSRGVPRRLASQSKDAAHHPPATRPVEAKPYATTRLPRLAAGPCAPAAWQSDPLPEQSRTRPPRRPGQHKPREREREREPPPR